MLRLVTSDGQIISAPIHYKVAQPHGKLGLIDVPAAAALISIAHVNQLRGKEIFVQVGHISSGSTAVAYSLDHGQLVASGVVLGYGGDGGTRANFQCLAGNPARLLQHTYQLVQVIHDPMYGVWNETTVTYAWHGPRLVKIAQSTVNRRLSPRDTVGISCIKGIA